MLFYHFRHKCRKSIIEYFYYYRNIIKSKLVETKEKTISIDISGIVLNRYLYNFISFFQISGFTVYLPKDKKMISILSKKKGEFLYASWILKEKIKFGKPNSPNLIISKNQLSNDYFGSSNDSKEFHVPMSEFPAFYFCQFKTPSIDLNKRRKNSIFMSGNMDSTYYYNISKSKFFNVLSRREVADFVTKKAYYIEVYSLEGVNDFINADNDCKLLLIDTKEKFRIPFKDLKSILVEFNYYLALPGIFIPQSHNLIESMSVGCIPVIHKNYASLFTPALQHMKNAIVYSSLDDLDIKILELFKFDVQIINLLRTNVYLYHNNNLSPKSVVRKIENNNFSKIYIQAEQKSLEFLYKKN
jgi:hypothetical protein